jgi:hypothetical protein
MKHVRKTVGYTWTDYKNKCRDSKGIKYNSSFGQNEGLERNWIRNINRMAGNRLPRITKLYIRNHGRQLKRLLDV